MFEVVNKKTHKVTGDDFYIGRGSPLGNPHAVGESSHPDVKFLVATNEEAVAGFKKHLKESIENGIPAFCDAVNELIIRNLLGKPCNLVCFCAPKPCHGEVIREFVLKQKYCLNWFSNMRRLEVPIVNQGIEYWTVENFYQAMKTPRDNVELRREIAAMGPFEAKRAARQIELRSDWDQLKIPVMRRGLVNKFRPDLKWGKLLKTVDKEIVEWNNWKDCWWGRCIFTGEGENRLGKLVMEIRGT